MNVSLLIHTFNGYKHLWPGCIEGWETVLKCEPCDLYFGTDEPIDYDFKPFTPLYSGNGEWSDRLIRLLHQIPTDYVFYSQEDHWPIAYPPIFSKMIDIMESKGLLRLQLAPITRFYTMFSEDDTIYFDPSSKYLVSHQPSIWKKDFLLSVLHPNESPWKNEYEGTKRLNNDPSIKKKIAIYPCDWFAHKCIKGKVVES